MIIGVSGKIGSGKDLTGQIILGLKAGLSTEEILKLSEEDSWWLEDKSNFEIRKFADKLKDMVCMLIGCTREQLEDREFKEKELGEEWWYWSVYEGIEYKPSYFSTKEEAQKRCLEIWGEDFETYIKLVKLTPRKLLQLLGTDCGRNMIHPNIWINALFADYKVYKDEELPNWIITDVRFPNEAKAIKNRGGILIRIERDYVLRGGPEDPKNQHPSETALDDYQDFDYVIENNGSIEDLINKIKKIINGTDIN